MKLITGKRKTTISHSKIRQAFKKALADYGKNIHVISRSPGWAVVKEGAGRASKVFPERRSAIRYARKINKEGKVFVHRKNGLLEREIKIRSK